jgi:hypothetical protein
MVGSDSDFRSIAQMTVALSKWFTPSLSKQINTTYVLYELSVGYNISATLLEIILRKYPLTVKEIIDTTHLLS